jgi:hypothetical protein
MTYTELVEFCGSERQAHYIAQRLPYRDLSEFALTEKIIELMIAAKERASGPATIKYLGGIRRDTLRG